MPWRASQRRTDRDSIAELDPEEGLGGTTAVDAARLRDLERKIARLQQQDRAPDELRSVERRLKGLSERLERLTERIDDLEVRGPSASFRQASDPVLPGGELRALPDRLREAEAEIAALKARPDAGLSLDAASITAPIDRTVMRLSDRLQRLEELVIGDDAPKPSLLRRLFRRK